jgi:hypothetical protein
MSDPSPFLPLEPVARGRGAARRRPRAACSLFPETQRDSLLLARRNSRCAFTRPYHILSLHRPLYPPHPDSRCRWCVCKHAPSPLVPPADPMRPRGGRLVASPCSLRSELDAPPDLHASLVGRPVLVCPPSLDLDAPHFCAFLVACHTCF